MKYRHGDLSFHLIKSLPKEIKKAKNNVLAEGETTGHKHVITGDVKIYQDTFGNTYLKVGNKAVISHEEHKPIEIKKGLYKMFNEREKDWFSLSVRRVID